MTVASTATVAVQDAQKILSDIETAKTNVVASLQAHIAAHQKQAAQHNAEVAAAQALIQKADPTASPAQAEAAAFVLTSHSTWVAGVVNFFGKNWRYVAIGGILIAVVVAVRSGLVHI